MSTFLGSPSAKGSTIKGKNLSHPPLGSKCFSFRVDPFSEVNWCSVKKEVSNSVSLVKNWRKIYRVYSFTLRENHHYENTPIQIYIYKKSPPETEHFQIKKLIFSYVCSKHRLLVPVRTALPRRFERVSTIYVLSKNKKNNVYPCKPLFYYSPVSGQLYHLNDRWTENDRNATGTGPVPERLERSDGQFHFSLS